ncbi:KAP family P-loop NTPase fold protein [Clostridium baratii]|uniref:KAP family P-loop NTPase fold protein n=1 Tax=Clostridium baratii TaxID=1561 RepID=UPI0005F2E7E2|nr:P-loop NTPase fold protein [Clostridium baratii]KJU71827.1 hypothetical protein UC77_07605 [Clostridium baratii]
MGIFDNNVIIDAEKPFANDKLNREPEADNLTNLFSLVDNQMVLAVNSSWGTGKSSFLQMWNKKLINDGYDTVFFNAWENDFVEDAFIAFINEIRESLQDRDTDGLIENAKQLGELIFKNSPKVIAKFIEKKTGIDIESIVSTDDIANLIGDKIDDYKNAKDSIKQFKEELEELAQESVNVTGKPIIIFVDELDRCRPNFAIKLLERIKHLFSVKNIIFVLGIDKDALSNSIKVVYGESTEINGYLARFIDMEYKLKEISIEEYIGYLLEKYEFGKLFLERRKMFSDYIIESEYDYRYFFEIVCKCISGFKTSLREIEKIIVELYLIIKANIKKYIYPYSLILLCILKRFDKDMYNKIKIKQIKVNNAIKEINNRIYGFENWINKEENIIFKSYLIWLLNDNEEINRLRECIDNGRSIGEDVNIENRCLQIYDYISQGKGYSTIAFNDESIKTNIFNMIDLYDNFTNM